MQNFFILWQDIGLVLYAILKAFLPLPSLEVILVPLCLRNPEKWFVYSIEGAIGTCIGGAIGYAIAYFFGRPIVKNIACDEDVDKGERLMNKYGLLAVFIGGITPLPDFLLAYLAGFTHMNFLSFTLCDGFARFLRSVLVCYGLKTLGDVIDVDAFGMWITAVLFAWLIYKWIKTKQKLHAQTTSKK